MSDELDEAKGGALMRSTYLKAFDIVCRQTISCREVIVASCRLSVDQRRPDLVATSVLPPSNSPPTPTFGMRPPITLMLYGSKVLYTWPHRCPGPMLTVFLSSLRVIPLRPERSMRMLALILEKPGFGECPPLRTENGTLKCLIIFSAVETCCAVFGWMMQLGCSQHIETCIHINNLSLFAFVKQRSHQLTSTAA